MELKDAKIGQYLYTKDRPRENGKTWVLIKVVNGVFGTLGYVVEVSIVGNPKKDPCITSISKIADEGDNIGFFIVKGNYIENEGINAGLDLNRQLEKFLDRVTI